MRNLLIKEIRLSASVLAYVFILFGLMFFVPGYPILCGVFFSTLGLFKSFEFAREANDIVFTALLPVGKKDVVKGRFAFVCLIELATLFVMAIAVILRMTVFADAALYRGNIMMNANGFALGAAFFLFGLFNWIFVGGFFRTGYQTGRPFLIYMIVAFLAITGFETLHHLPGLEILNAFGTVNVVGQSLLLGIGILCWLFLTGISCRRACIRFEKIDL